mmetsp:Transcript_6561/g.9635  ORF Transcript_6561/g.9635 Transcript_6561/m.9635 type:complete len:213 (+) Transcript_6561:30-668(+)
MTTALHSLTKELKPLNLHPTSKLTINDLKKAAFKAKRQPNANHEMIEDAYQKLFTRVQSFDTDPMNQASKIIHHLYLGPHKIARNRNELQKLHIQSIITMTAECGAVFQDENEFEYLDVGYKLVEHECIVQDILHVINQVYIFANDAIEKGKNVLIHCVQGKTRSACAVVYILAKRENQSIQESYEYVKGKRSICIPDEWLESLQEHLDESE